MAVDEFPGEPYELHEPVLEDVAVITHRARLLIQAGVAPEDAVTLAERKDVDVHDVLKLIKQGCPVDTAVKIAL